MPKLSRPSSMWSSMAIWPATAAGWVFGMLIVPVPSLIERVRSAIQARNIAQEVMFSALSVVCSPQ
jgi:hypothetical protein